MSGLFVSKLWIYPVKGCRGVAVERAEVDAYGLVGDRRALVVDAAGRMITQRTHPTLALVEARWSPGRLHLSTTHRPELEVNFDQTSARTRLVSVWSSEGLVARDAGPEASAWWSEFLGQEAHLVYVGPEYQRPLKAGRGTGTDEVSFADGAPLLVTLEASLDRLNDWIIETGEEPVPMDRFRPNVVVSGGTPFAEDKWSTLRIGEVTLRDSWPCARCVVTTTEQTTGERGKEPLRTLARFRRDARKPSDVNFGINWINHEKTGSLRVGEPVLVTERSD